MLSSYTGVGRLTDDAEMKYTDSGTAISNFTIAINNRRNEEKTLFLQSTLYGKQAEAVSEYLKKGVGVAVAGELWEDRWKNSDGKMTSRVSLDINTLTLLPKSSQGENKD